LRFFSSEGLRFFSSAGSSGFFLASFETSDFPTSLVDTLRFFSSRTGFFVASFDTRDFPTSLL